MNQLLDTALDRSLLLGYSRAGYLLRHRSWSELPRLDGQTVAVTGATSGIGAATAHALAGLGAEVVLVARNPERAEQTRGEIIASTGNRAVSVVICDLASLDSVRAAAAQINAHGFSLRALINNAGVMTESRQMSVDGFELTFATNVLGPFLLTNLLIPALSKHAPGRIITVSSGGMYAQRLEVQTLQMEGEEFNGTTAYARTKRAEVALTEQWAARLSATEVVAHAMHPGWVNTPGVETSLPTFHKLTRRILRTPAEGADTILWLAAAHEPEHSTGRFWHDRRERPTHYLPTTRESGQEAVRLWQRCVELTGFDPQLEQRPATS